MSAMRTTGLAHNSKHNDLTTIVIHGGFSEKRATQRRYYTRMRVSGVIRIVLFLAKLNGLNTCATDIGNAYLEANNKEKVC